MPDLRKQAHDLGRPFTDQYGTSEDETMHEDGRITFNEKMLGNISRRGSMIWIE